MAGKPRPIIIELNSFPAYLAAWMSIKNKSVSATAHELGISPPAIYALMSGELAPSAEIARKVGLRPAWIVEKVAGSDSEIEEEWPKPAGKSKK